MIDEKTKRMILGFQKNEITEHFIYEKLARLQRDKHNREILKKISEDELRHYRVWQEYSGREANPDKFKVWFYLFISRIFGITFGLKLMESGEDKAQQIYEGFIKTVAEAEKIKKDETEHENELLGMIDEERLKYIGSVVLGLNDALVELTGTLAGLTFALQNNRLVGMAGLITGIAAALSMAASEYLSTKTEGGEKNPLRASIYTGITYIGAVTVLILPYLLLNNPFISLGAALLGGVVLIFIFTFYYSVVRDVSFKRRFSEMVAICLGVATLSFLIGLLVRQFLGVEV